MQKSRLCNPNLKNDIIILNISANKYTADPIIQFHSFIIFLQVIQKYIN